MSISNPPVSQAIMTAKAAAGFGTAMSVGYYSNVQLMLATASSANFTLKIQGSFATTQPDFTAAASASNPWFYVASWNLDSNALTVGSTGYVSAGTDVFVGILVNTDGLAWLNGHLSARSAGTISLTAYVNND